MQMFYLLLQGQLEVAQLDLADLSSIQQFARHLKSQPSVDILICNAGIMACPKSYTKNGFEMQIGTNHFGHFALTDLLMDKFKQQVTLSYACFVHLWAHFAVCKQLSMHYSKCMSISS